MSDPSASIPTTGWKGQLSPHGGPPDWIEIIVTTWLNAADFEDLCNFSAPMDSTGKKWRPDLEAPDPRKTKIFRIQLQYADRANKIFKKYNLPLMDVQKVRQLSGKVRTGKREATHLTITLKADLRVVSVLHNNTEHLIPFANIDILYDVVKATKSISPRHCWYSLAMRHNLFPEIREIDTVIRRDSYSSKTRQSQLVSWLHGQVTKIFEGSRREKDNRIYYEYYWYPRIVLSKLLLVEQQGRGNIDLTSVCDNWVQKAQRMGFDRTLEFEDEKEDT